MEVVETADSRNLIQHNKVQIKTQISYGTGQVAGQILRDIPSLLLLFYMTNVLGIAAAIAGIAIFLPKICVGVASDLAVGTIADRLRHKVPLYNWLLFCVGAAPVAMLLIFHVPAANQTIQLIYIVLAVSIYMLVFASFSVPYLAIASSLAHNSQTRTVLMAWRLGFSAIGLLIAGGLAPALIAKWGGGIQAYSSLAILLATICSATIFVSYLGARKSLISSQSDSNQSAIIRVSVSAMLNAVKVPEFSILLGVSILQLAGAGMSYATMLYFLKDVMALNDPFTTIGFIVFATTMGIIVAQPIWVALSKRVGKKNGYVIASLVHAVILAAWALGGASFGLNFILICAFFAGVGNSGWMMLGASILVDIAGKGNAGLFSSVWIAADKIGIALGGTLLAGLVLSGFGFDSLKAMSGLVQSSNARLGIMAAFGLIPASCFALGGILFHVFGEVKPPNPQNQPAPEQI